MRSRSRARDRDGVRPFRRRTNCDDKARPLALRTPRTQDRRRAPCSNCAAAPRPKSWGQAGQVGSGLNFGVRASSLRPDPENSWPARPPWCATPRAGPWMTATNDRSLTAHCYDAVDLQNSSAVSEARATMPEHVPKFRRFEFINLGTPTSPP